MCRTKKLSFKENWCGRFWTVCERFHDLQQGPSNLSNRSCPVTWFMCQRTPTTHVYMDHSSPISFLPALVRGAAPSVECGYRQRYIVWAWLFCLVVGHWKMGLAQLIFHKCLKPSLGTSYHKPGKTQLLAAWYWKNFRQISKSPQS